MHWGTTCRERTRTFIAVTLSDFRCVRRWYGGVWEKWLVAGLEVDYAMWFPVMTTWEASGDKPTHSYLETPLETETW